MRTASDNGGTVVDTGFVILLGEGRRRTDDLYETREQAEAMINLVGVTDATVVPAKRVWNVRRPRRADWIMAEGCA